MPDLSIGYDSSKAAAGMAVWLREAKRGGDAARQLEAETKKAGVAAGGAGRQLKDAGDKAQRMVRQQELVARVMRETGASAATAGKAVRVFGTDMDRAEKEAVGLARQLDVAEKEIRQLAHAQRTASGTGLTAALKRQAVGLASIAAGALGAQAALREFKEGFQDALDFEGDLKKLTTLVGVQSDVVAGWRDQIIGVSRVTGTLTDELGPALFQITSGGERGASAMKLLEDAAKASAIGLGDAADIGKIATAAYQAYGAAAFEAVSPTDILGATIREGALDTASLAGVMGQAIPLANQLGITFADLGGFVATFSRLGINAEESITAVRGAMAFLIKPTKEGQKALAEVGLSLEELRRIAREDGLAAVLLNLTAAFKGNEEGIAKVVPNIRALTGVLGTAGAFGEKYAEISRSIAEATGFIDDAFNELGDDPAQQARLITAEYEALRLELSTQFLPVLATVLESLRQVTDNDDAVDLFHRLGQAIKIATAIASLWITEQARVRDGMNELAASIGRLLRPWATLEAEMEQERKDLEASRAAREAWRRALEKATDGTRDFQAALDAVVPPPFDERPIVKLTDAQVKALAALKKSLDAATLSARANARVMASEAATLHLGARASEAISKELEIQAKIQEKLADATAKGLAGTKAFQAALREFEAALRAEAAAEEHLAGAKTIERLEQAVRAELALAAGSRAAVQELQLQAEIADAVSKATDDQATAIEALVRRLQALKIAREQATQLQGLLDEVEALNRLNAARAQGADVYRREVAQLEIEAELRKRIVTGLPLEVALIVALTQAKQRERQAAVNQETLDSLDEELAAWQLKLRVLQEAIEKGLSYAAAMREVAIAERTAQILKDSPGLDPETVRAQVATIYDAQTAYDKSAAQMQKGAGNMAQATGQMLEQLASAFELIGGEFGDMISALLRLIDTIYQAAQAMQAANASSSGGGGGASAGAGGSAFASIAAVIGVFVALYQIGSALIDKANAQKYSIPITGGITGGRFSGQAVASDAAGLSQQQTNAAVLAFRDAIESFEVALGRSLSFFPQLGIAVQNSGDKFRLTIAGVVYGIFDSFDEAFQAGFRIALGSIEAADIGPHLARALGLFGVSTEELVSIIPLLTRFDDALEGIPKGLSAALLAQRQWFTALDQESKLLLRSGVSLETVIQWRREEINAMIEQVRQGGLQLAGIRTFGAGLQEWIDAARATGEAAEEEAKRQDGLAASALNAATAVGGAGGGGGGGGLHGALVSGGSAAEGFGGSVVAFTQSLEDGRGPLDDSATGIHGVTNAFVEMVREIVKLEAAKSIFEDLLAFQERTGIQVVANADLREAIARLEFRLFQLRFQQTVLELIAAAELLGLTRAQIHEFERWAKAVGELDFSDISIGGGGGRGGRRQARQAAAEDFADAVDVMNRRLAGATPQMLAFSDAADRLREMGEAAGATTEEIAAALRSLAELQIADVVMDWEEAIRQASETDLQTSLRRLAERATADLAAAAAAAAENPDLFAGAADTIGQGFGAVFQGQIQDEIDRLVAAGDTAGLDALFAQVSTFLAGDFPPEMQGVIAMLRQWLAETVAGGRAAIADSERRTAAEEAYKQSAEEAAKAERELAAARKEARAALDDMVDRSLSPSVVALRDAQREYDETISKIEKTAKTEAERSAALAIADRELARARLEAIGTLYGEIEALARAAGVNLPVEMAREWAQIQYALAKAQLAVALSSTAVIAAFAAMEGGLARLEEWKKFVMGLPDVLPPLEREVERLGNAATRATRATRHFVLGIGLVEEGAEDTAETLAEIIEEMRRSELTGMAALEQERLDMLARIAAATGTAAERAIALAAAEELYARKRQELLDEAFGGVDEWLREITGAGILGVTPGEQLAGAQAELQDLAARAAGGDLEAAAALDDQAQAVIDLLSQLYGGRELALLAQQVVDTVAAARAAGGGAAPQALGPTAPLTLPPLAALPPAPFSAALGTAQAVADLTTVVATLQTQGDATRRQMADLTQAEMRQRATLHGEVVPLLRDLRPPAPIAPPGGRG